MEVQSDRQAGFLGYLETIAQYDICGGLEVARNCPQLGKNLQKRLKKLVHLSMDKSGFA